MAKNVLKATSLSALALMLGSVAANAAVPANTIVIGNKAFSVGYLVDDKNAAEIQKALDAVTNPAAEIYYQLEGEAKWTNLFDETQQLDNEGLAKVIPTVTYYDAEGKTTEEKFVETPVVVETLKVDSVSAITNTKLEVTLEEAITKLDSFNFTVEGLTISSKTLSTDGKTVTLVTSAQEAGKLYTLKAGTYTGTFVGLVEDTTEPGLTLASALTNQSVKVTFDNEDLDPATALNVDNYAISGLTVSAAVWGDDHSEVILTTSEQTSGKLYELKVNNVTDLSGNKIDTDSSKKFGGKAKDTTKPVVSSALGKDGNKVEVTFTESQLLDSNTALDISNYTINNGLQVLSAEFKEDTNELNASPVVILTTSAQTVGKLYTVTVKSVADASGNVVTSTDKNFGGSPKDTTKLGVDSAVATANTTVVVDFNDTVDEATATNIANYTISGLEVLSAEIDEDDDTKVVLTTSAQTAGKLYTLSVQNILDDAANVLDTSKDEFKFGGKAVDKTDPTVTSINAIDRNTVKVVYSEKVNEATAEALVNYNIEGLGYPTKATLASDGVTVTLKTASQSSKLYTLTINNVTDLAGNKLDADTEVKFAGVGTTIEPLKVESAYALNKNQVKVIFNQSLAATSNAYFTIADSSTSDVDTNDIVGNPNDADITGENDNEVILTWTSKSMNADEVYSVTVATQTGKYGAVIDTDYDEDTFAGVDQDKADITIDAVNVIDNKTIDIVFSEDVSGTLTGLGAKFGLYKAEGNIPATTNASADILGTGNPTINGNTVRVTLASALEQNTVYYLNMITGNGVKDITGNFDATFDADADTSESIFASGDVVAPELVVDSAVMVDENTLDIYFNQDINLNSFSLSGDITIKKGNTNVVSGGELKDYSVSHNKLRVYFVNTGSDFVAGDVLSVVLTDNAHVEYKYQTSINLGAADAEDQKADFAAVDTENEAPYIVSASAVADNKAVITLSEAVEGASGAGSVATEVTKADLKVRNATTGEVLNSSDYAIATYAAGDTELLLTVTNGKFVAGQTYEVAIVNGSDLTDIAGIDAIDKAGVSDWENSVTFTGNATQSIAAPTSADLAKLGIVYDASAYEMATSITGLTGINKTLQLTLDNGTTWVAVGTTDGNGDLTVNDKVITSASYIVGATPKYRFVDKAGNLGATSDADGVILAANTFTPANVATDDTLAATDTITVTFWDGTSNKNVTIGGTLAEADFTTGGDFSLGTATFNSGDQASLIITVGSSSPAIDASVAGDDNKLVIDAAAANKITGTAGGNVIVVGTKSQAFTATDF